MGKVRITEGSPELKFEYQSNPRADWVPIQTNAEGEYTPNPAEEEKDFRVDHCDHRRVVVGVGRPE